MEITGNTILITGGATGIGLALAEVFITAGNTVIICGRKENKLKQAKAKFSQIHTMVCDLSKEEERESLCASIKNNFTNLNILVNNAGIQNIIAFKKGTEEVPAIESEIAINLVAPIYLSACLVPFLFTKKEAAIINLSSSLGFVPKANKPVYCATKAAIHSFSLSLRHQLKDTSIKVFEVIPPMVDTGLVKKTTEEAGQVFNDDVMIDCVLIRRAAYL